MTGFGLRSFADASERSAAQSGQPIALLAGGRLPNAPMRPPLTPLASEGDSRARRRLMIAASGSPGLQTRGQKVRELIRDLLG